ncbi:MAG: RagB/SusD family nutrient uptake outer membrane protein [Tidjanibacter sp.]|nr:RagB/SusD family nutrient uptake outer membrane protein [Tidjanibacter sp.]
MKKFLLMLAATATMIGSMSSCSNLDGLLDEVNYGNPTVEDMVTDEQNVILLVGQCYADLKWIHDHWGYWGLVTISADEGLCVPRNKGNDWNDGGYWMKQNDHTWDFRGDAIKNVWNTTISGAVSCNRVLQTLELGKENMSEEIYAQYVGEVEVLRTYYFYLLFECFGRVPYTETYEEVVGPMNEPWETWSNLVAVLERNAPNMAIVTNDNRAANYGRTTQGFAYALLARLYLNAESYGCNPDNVFQKVEAPEQYSGSFLDNCVRCCDKVIEAGSYSIENNYFSNFRIFNENSKENILSIVDNGQADFDERSNGSMSNKLRITMNTHHYGIQQAYGMVLDTWNGFCARPDFLKLYNDNDVRGMGKESERNGTGDKKEWGWFVGPVYKASATAEQIAARDVNAMYLDEDYKEPTIIRSTISEQGGRPYDTHNFDGARLNKWEADKTGTYKYCENDFVLMRYADVLWMKEEAIVRGGAGVSGINGVSKADFENYFKRAMGSVDAFKAAYPEASTSLTEKGILDERGREFTWEMVRRRDLIRYGEFGNIQYVAKKNDYLKWYPIPRSVLEKSLIGEDGKRLWTQNEGYEDIKAPAVTQ